MKFTIPSKAIGFFRKIGDTVNKFTGSVAKQPKIPNNPEDYKLEAYLDKGSVKVSISPKEPQIVEKELYIPAEKRNYRLNPCMVRSEFVNRVVCMVCNGKE